MACIRISILFFFLVVFLEDALDFGIKRRNPVVKIAQRLIGSERRNTGFFAMSILTRLRRAM